MTNGLRLALALFMVAFATGARAAGQPAWTQFTARGLEVRTITDQAECPSVRFDDTELPMEVRARPSDTFAITVCALPVPERVSTIRIGDTLLPHGTPALRRIAIIGDTGCRLNGYLNQACNDPDKWPFRAIAEAVAAAKPDLVIHVGDYHYREAACPPVAVGCAGSPYGDTWNAWQADFFTPVARLLPAAPWIFVRGNHEECVRAGQGWSRILESAPFDVEKAECIAVGPPYVVKFDGLSMAVVDAALAREAKLDEASATRLADHYKAVAAQTSGPTWVLQHKPIWSPDGITADKSPGDNRTLAAAARSLAPNVTALVTGHVHIFQLLSYTTDLPVEIVAGNSGDALMKGVAANPAGWTSLGATVREGVHLPGVFGFTIADKDGEGWRVTNYDRAGKAMVSCTMTGRTAHCGE